MHKLYVLSTTVLTMLIASCATAPISDSPPVATTRVPAIYPRSMKIEGRTGSVLVEFTVDTSGAVEEVTVVEADSPAFAQAAVDAIKQWKFKPGYRNGIPVKVKLRERLDFNINP